MELQNIVPWGRTLAEYRAMFMLSDTELQGTILGCGDGPASFNSEVKALGGKVISIDPIYSFDKEQISNRIDEVADEVMAQVRMKTDDFVWQNISSPDALYRIRMEAMHTFLDDYKLGKSQGRYIHEALPTLSFKSKQFDVVLSSHFLLLYSTHLDEAFHIEAILEMLRVSKEVRIFPIITLEGKRSPHLDGIMARLKTLGYLTTIEKVAYEFQKGGDEMLRVRRSK